jgi:hypothetical protein
LRHGLSSQSVVLPHEDGEQFQQLVQDHIDQFQPQTAVQMDLVEAMAAARWRLRRLYAVETAVFDNEMERRAEDIDDQFTDISDVGRLGWVFQKLADYVRTLAHLTRYEGSLNRSFDRALKQLHLLQSARSDAQNEAQQNEPNPPLVEQAISSPVLPDQTPTPAGSDVRAAGLPPGSARDSASAARKPRNRDRQGADKRENPLLPQHDEAADAVAERSPHEHIGNEMR